MFSRDTKFMSIDLELNQPSRSIIQLGWAISSFQGNISRGGRIIYSNELLDPFITKLTGITQDEVDRGVPLEEVYRKLVGLHRLNKAWINLVVWGGGIDGSDVSALKQALNPQIWPFGRRFIDVKTLYQAWRINQGMHPANGLRKAMSSMGLKFEGDAHNASWDAYNTLKLFFHLLGKFKE